jgi:hypothetical protein
MTAMRWIVLFCLLFSIGGCQPKPDPDQPVAFDQHVYGPTELSKVSNGYELKNRILRAVISDQTGDVTFWGFVDQNRNLLGDHKIYPTLTGLPASSPKGTIEKRDDETWQFFGDDDNHITWRKIYRLNGDSLFVSIQIQNNRPDLLVTTEQINCDLPDMKITHHDPELLEASIDHTTLSFRGFNEFPAPTIQPAMPVLIQSDTFHLKPQERQSYTTEWKLQAK